jgi:hypothetical protein
MKTYGSATIHPPICQSASRSNGPPFDILHFASSTNYEAVITTHPTQQETGPSLCDTVAHRREGGTTCYTRLEQFRQFEGLPNLGRNISTNSLQAPVDDSQRRKETGDGMVKEITEYRSVSILTFAVLCLRARMF